MVLDLKYNTESSAYLLARTISCHGRGRNEELQRSQEKATELCWFHFIPFHSLKLNLESKFLQERFLFLFQQDLSYFFL
jgi:hypothetical protein